MLVTNIMQNQEMFDQMYDWNQYQEQDASSNGLARTLKGNKGGISPGSLSPLN